jgi:hypothetical protein
LIMQFLLEGGFSANEICPSERIEIIRITTSASTATRHAARQVRIHTIIN